MALAKSREILAVATFIEDCDHRRSGKCVILVVDKYGENVKCHRHNLLTYTSFSPVKNT